MSTLEDRPNTALLVVDVQNGVVEGTVEREAVVANVGRLVEKARGEQVPVVWVQQTDERFVPGSEEWRIVPELDPDDQVIAHTNLYWTYETAPGRSAGTVETKDGDFRVAS